MPSEEVLQQLREQWANSGLSATTPPEPTGEEHPIPSVLLRLLEFLHNQGWSHVALHTCGSMWSSADGTWSVLIQATPPTSMMALLTSGAKASPGGQPTPNTRASGGMASPAPRRARLNAKATAGPGLR